MKKIILIGCLALVSCNLKKPSAKSKLWDANLSLAKYCDTMIKQHFDSCKYFYSKIRSADRDTLKQIQFRQEYFYHAGSAISYQYVLDRMVKLEKDL